MWTVGTAIGREGWYTCRAHPARCGKTTVPGKKQMPKIERRARFLAGNRGQCVPLPACASSAGWMKYLRQRQVALVGERGVDQLGRVALVLVRVAEPCAAHLDHGAPALDVVPQLLLPDPVLRGLGPIPRWRRNRSSKLRRGSKMCDMIATKVGESHAEPAHPVRGLRGSGFGRPEIRKPGSCWRHKPFWTHNQGYRDQHIQLTFAAGRRRPCCARGPARAP